MKGYTMSHRTKFGSIATYVAHCTAIEQQALRDCLADTARRDIAAGRYQMDDLPNGCDLWFDLQVEQELKF